MVVQKIFVVAGPSGAGKGTLLRRLMNKYSSLRFSVSSTSREPRPGEENGREYFFVSKDEFRTAVDQKLFLEHTFVHGNYYGTSVAQVERVRSDGKICLLEIDLDGVRQVKESVLGKEANYVFISPPSIEILERRLRLRGTESDDKIKLRVKHAVFEMEKSETLGFNKIIMNDDVDTAYKGLEEFVATCYPNVDADPGP